MKTFRKQINIFLAVMMLLSFSACQKENKPSYPDRDVDYPTELPAFEEDAVAIHYQRSDDSYDKWTLWLWDPEGTDDSKEDDFNYQDDYGVIAVYPLSYFGELSGGRLGIIVKTKGAWTKDGTDDDRFIVFSDLNKDENNLYHVYLCGDDAHIYLSPDKTISDTINTVRFTSGKEIFVGVSNPLEKVRVFKDGTLIKEENGAGRSKFTIALDEDADLSGAYSIEVEFRGSGEVLKADISSSGLYTTDLFNDQYYYDGELGAIYSPEKTVFKVWSPVSSRIELRIYENGTPKALDARGDDTFTPYEMNKGEKGVFEYTLEGDNEGLYYTYFVYNSHYPDGREIVDPYAYSTGINGVRGMVVDFSRTDPEGWDSVDYLDYDRKELVVYETHVADVTSSDTWCGPADKARKYLGMIEEATIYSEDGQRVATGFDHIKELGVNALQLQPIYDQDNDERSYTFNWGYNPLNYNTLEGMYSMDPYDGYERIREFKQLVKAYHDAGITVIMDVVYNHMSYVTGTGFDVLMPEYYFRYKNDGSLSNGSGCGNETASENPMMRKFIIDSICFWTREYKLGGFRFDLMGLHDIETMNQVQAAASKINPHVVIYGEPWTGGATTLDSALQAKQDNGNLFIGYGQFNDRMRDALIKGGLSDKSEKGWASGTQSSQDDLNAIAYGINGRTYMGSASIDDPNKTVNYVTCHDNYTLYDRMKAAGIEDETTVKQMAMLANSVVLTSNGTTFILAGEEMLRTKQGDSNSYMSSDEINQLDYSLKLRNRDMFENYQKLIEFKKNTRQLCSDDSKIDVEFLDNGAVIMYTLHSGDKEYLVVHCNGKDAHTEIDAAGYSLYLDTLNLLSDPLSSFVPAHYQTVILIRK